MHLPILFCTCSWSFLKFCDAFILLVPAAGERTYGAMQCASLEAAGASGDAILDAAGHAGM